MPVTAEMAERWGLVNHAVDDNEVLSKDIEVAEAIARNNRNLLYSS
jgi:enoyl-CoA hydratase/carnithine racemase